MKNKIIDLPEEIIFVTSNKGKIATAQKYFKDIKLKAYNYDLIEPRTDDIKEIAESKVRQAYKVVKKPCIALDAGFFIEDLNGFPRAFVNFALDTLGIEGILKQMEGIKNRKCTFKESLAYFDGKNLLFFEGIYEGTLSKKIRGIDNKEKWSDLWYIFIPGGYDKTLAEMTKDEIYSIPKSLTKTSALDEFAIYYNETKNNLIRENN